MNASLLQQKDSGAIRGTYLWKYRNIIKHFNNNSNLLFDRVIRSKMK